MEGFRLYLVAFRLFNMQETCIEQASLQRSEARKLQERQKKLRRKIPPEKWRKREELSDSSHRKLTARFDSLVNGEKILNSLGKLGQVHR